MNINRRVGRSRTCFRKRGWHVILGNENVLYRWRSRWGRDARPWFMFSGSSVILWRQSVETQGWRNAGFVCKNRDHGIRRRSSGEQCWDRDCHSMEDALSWAGTGRGVRKRREGAESWSCWAGYRRLRIGRCQWLPGFQMCYQLVTATIHTQSSLWQCSCCSSWGGLAPVKAELWQAHKVNWDSTLEIFAYLAFELNYILGSPISSLESETTGIKT